MTGEFPPSGEGRPTDDQVKEARDYLLRHNRNASVRSTHAELVANGFALSIPTVARALKGTGRPEQPRKPSPIAKAEARVSNRRAVEGRVKGEKKEEGKPDLLIANLTLTPDQTKELATMAGLLVDTNSSTSLAIKENRARMALNIVLMEHMAARPELMLLDMRGTGLLVDALTVASKLSGGASIDITVPNPGGAVPMDNPSPGGHPMRDITPVKGPLSDELDAFRRKRDADAKRA